MLEIKDLVAGYGALPVVRGISLTVSPGSVVVILGVNGSGKSTTLRAISGMVSIFSGTVTLDGKNITKKPPHKVARLGIGHCLEGKRVFPFLNVEENLDIAGYMFGGLNQAKLDQVYSLFPMLRERKRQKAESLSGGERQMLVMGQALISGSRYLLLDEVSNGLSPLLTTEMGKTIKGISQGGIGILWAEQNARVALLYSDYCILLHQGEILLSGESGRLMANEVVKREYLGVA